MRLGPRIAANAPKKISFVRTAKLKAWMFCEKSPSGSYWSMNLQTSHIIFGQRLVWVLHIHSVLGFWPSADRRTLSIHSLSLSWDHSWRYHPLNNWWMNKFIWRLYTNHSNDPNLRSHKLSRGGKCTCRALKILEILSSTFAMSWGTSTSNGLQFPL